MTEYILNVENNKTIYLPTRIKIISFEGSLTYYFKYMTHGLEVFIYLINLIQIKCRKQNTLNHKNLFPRDTL